MDTLKRMPLQEQNINTSHEKTIEKDDLGKPVKKTLVTSKSESENFPMQHDVSYFRNLVNKERMKLTNLCDEWKQCQLEVTDSINVDRIMGDIRTVVGQANLIMDERFTQFQGLIDHCELGTSEKPVKCLDLQGFWDMVHVQVEDVDRKFAELKTQKENSWNVEALAVAKKCRTKKKIFKKNAANPRKSDGTAEAKRAEARKRLAAAKAALKKEPEVTFNAGFFTVESPARSITCCAKTPSSKERKRLATPSSDNFLHGRYLRKLVEAAAPDLKKSLQFENDEDDVVVEKKQNIETDLCEIKADIKDAPLISNKPKTCKVEAREIAVQTDKTCESALEEAFERVSKEFKLIQETQIKMQSHLSQKEAVSKAQCLEMEKGLCMSRNEIDSNAKAGDSDTIYADESYTAHYRRLLMKVQLLEAELSSYQKLKAVLELSQSKWVSTLKLFEVKKSEMETYHEKVKLRESALRERENKENKELIQLRQVNKEQIDEIVSLKQKLVQIEDVSEKLVFSIQMNESLANDCDQFQKKCHKLESETIKLQKELTEKCSELEVVEENMLSLQQNRKTQEEEHSQEKSFWLQEKEMLQNQLTNTEKMVEDTKNLLEKAKTKSNEHVNKINTLSAELATTEMKTKKLQDEVDITKADTRLAIIEQQQEVKSCECQLRGLSTSMEKFLAKLKCIDTGKETWSDYKTLMQDAAKTPSKSLVVSALLQKSGDGSFDDWSPVVKSDGKAEACLYSLTEQVVVLMNDIIKNAREVALHHNQEVLQLQSEKSALVSKVELLKNDISKRDNQDNSIELSLRRRLNDVIAQRDLYLQALKKSEQDGKNVAPYRC
ncbi:uncharacterized protein LOC143462955 isoform X2 [Clavelina lepadiformis]|uniref:Uncharacterized protein n=1 Tax=Clavelina lepadiformis TaxID=159417 RepID=A0ABP0GL56_CLALP